MKIIELEKDTENRVLYIDNHLAVFNKHSGEICESWTPLCKENKENYVPFVFLKVANTLDTKVSFCQCFNRLDRPVSGANLLVLEKNVSPLLQNQFTNNHKGTSSVKKSYWAIVEGIVEKMDSFEVLEHYIRFDASKQKSFVYKTNERKTKLARMAWRSIGHGDNYSFIEIELYTGRTHQIRAQLSAAGMHIKGDVKYGAKRQDTLSGIRLHARTLEFLHPITKNIVSVNANLPVKDPLWKAFEACIT